MPENSPVDPRRNDSDSHSDSVRLDMDLDNEEYREEEY